MTEKQALMNLGNEGNHGNGTTPKFRHLLPGSFVDLPFALLYLCFAVLVSFLFYFSASIFLDKRRFERAKRESSYLYTFRNNPITTA